MARRVEGFAMKPTFFKFITDTYLAANSPAGDLARDIVADPDFPATTRSAKVVREYLQGRGACTPAMDAFEDVAKSYGAKAERTLYVRNVPPEVADLLKHTAKVKRMHVSGILMDIVAHASRTGYFDTSGGPDNDNASTH